MSVPATMSAMVLTGHGGFDKLEWHDDWPVPEPGAGEVLIRVLACGLNNTDVNTRTGWYAKEVRTGTTGESLVTDESDGSWGGSVTFPRIQGADVCGQVVAVGAGADPALIGSRVLIDTWFRDWDDPMNMDKCRYYGSEINGGFAQYTVAPVRQVHVIDSPLSDAELASFATSYVTAENMLNRAQVGPGDRVLVTGASGGVGSALIQLANRRGAECVALCGTDKAAAVAELGPIAVLPREPEDLAGAIEAATGWTSVSVVADVVGGPVFPQMIEVLQRGGRYTCAGAIAGPIVELDLRTFYLNDLTFKGATIVAPDTFADLVDYIARGEVRPLLAATYPLRDLVAAQKAFLSKAQVGNIVVIP